MLRGLLTGIMFGVILVIFSLQNSIKVPVKFLWMKFTEVPLALMVLIALITGIIITSLFAFIDKQRLRSRIKRLQARLKELNNPENEDEIVQKGRDFKNEDEITIEGEPGHKFFDY